MQCRNIQCLPRSTEAIGCLHNVLVQNCPDTDIQLHCRCPQRNPLGGQALDRGAVLMGANKIATGHNADDVAETVLLNILRGDVPR